MGRRSMATVLVVSLLVNFFLILRDFSDDQVAKSVLVSLTDTKNVMERAQSLEQIDSSQLISPLMFMVQSRALIKVAVLEGNQKLRNVDSAFDVSVTELLMISTTPHTLSVAEMEKVKAATQVVQQALTAAK
jgi:hypothetical protein